LSAARARSFLPPDRLVGVSAHDPREIERARRAGADYVSLSPLFPPSSKSVPATVGVEAAIEWTRDAGLPVVWLGGIDAERIRELPAGLPAAGFAVLGAVCNAQDPCAAAAGIVAAAARHRRQTP
jgi:thiamine-phosphate pyrophosphorylase